MSEALIIHTTGELQRRQPVKLTPCPFTTLPETPLIQ